MFELVTGKMGAVNVVTSSDGGLPTEAWAERLTDKLISVSETAPEPIKAQAEAFKLAIKNASLQYMKEAVRSERERICAHLEKQGLVAPAQAIRSMD